MSDNYTGDGTMVGIGPDPGPGPEVAPVGVLFEDGEEADAASVEQLFKTLLNHVAYLYKPKASTSLATKFMKRWRTVLGHTRFALGRLGMPALTCLHWQELWDFSAFVTTGAQQNVYLDHSNRWKAWTSTTFTGSVKGIFVIPAGRDRLGGAGVPGCGSVRLAGCNAEGEFVAVASGTGCRLDPEADVVVEWIGSCSNGTEGNSTPEVMMGIAEAYLDDDTSLIDPRAVRGLKFIREIDQNNWLAVSRDGAGETVEDTGIAVSGGSKVRFRIEFRGASVNETSVPTAYFFIENNLVATITDNLPLGIGAQMMAAVKNTGAVALTRVVGVPYDAALGPVNFTCNVIPAVTA